MTLPTIFIASTYVDLGLAHALASKLVQTAECTTWDNGPFAISKYTMESLDEATSKFDFAAFLIPSQDQGLAHRDNILLELGMFISSIGLERCFVICPQNTHLEIATDLKGVTLAEYEHRQDANTSQAVTQASNKLKEIIKTLGKFQDSLPSPKGENEQHVQEMEDQIYDAVNQLRDNGEEITAQCAYIAASLYPQRFDSTDITKFLTTRYKKLLEVHNKGRHNYTTTPLIQRNLLIQPIAHSYEWNNEKFPVNGVVDGIQKLLIHGFRAHLLTKEDFLNWRKEK